MRLREPRSRKRPSSPPGQGRPHFYLSPTGRTGRLFYWLFGFLPLILLGVGAGLVVPPTQAGTRYLLTAVILLFWPQVVVLARRLHDLNLTGWWVTLFWLIPLALALLRTRRYRREWAPL